MKAPAFQFYPADFLADERVASMTNQAVGCYIKLMCFCWREGSIPRDVDRLAKLCGESNSAMAELWPSLSDCFDQSSKPDRLVDKRLDVEREKQEKFRHERSESGKKGAKSRYSTHGSAITEPLAEPVAVYGSSSSSSLSTREVTLPKDDKQAGEWAHMVGVPPEYGAKIFNDLSATVFEDGAGRPITNWQRYIKGRWGKKADADGREKEKRMGGARMGQRPEWAIRKDLESEKKRLKDDLYYPEDAVKFPDKVRRLAVVETELAQMVTAIPVQ